MRSALLLTTRPRAALAVALTAFVFALTIRDEQYGAHAKPMWLIFGGLLHGWSVIAINLAFYFCLCWSAFIVAHETKGRERLFMLGWFGFLLSPIKVLRPQWAVPVMHIETFGAILSLVAAVSLLLNPSEVVRSDGESTAGQSR